jgi:hypothetical protein
MLPNIASAWSRLEGSSGRRSFKLRRCRWELTESRRQAHAHSNATPMASLALHSGVRPSRTQRRIPPRGVRLAGDEVHLYVVPATNLSLATVGRAKRSQEQKRLERIAAVKYLKTRTEHAPTEDTPTEDASIKEVPMSTHTERYTH